MHNGPRCPGALLLPDGDHAWAQPACRIGLYDYAAQLIALCVYALAANETVITRRLVRRGYRQDVHGKNGGAGLGKSAWVGIGSLIYTLDMLLRYLVPRAVRFRPVLSVPAHEPGSGTRLAVATNTLENLRCQVEKIGR